MEHALLDTSYIPHFVLSLSNGNLIYISTHFIIMSYDESALLLMLVSFYECYNPSKVDTVPIILERFHGKEVELLHNLKQKYYLEAYPPFDNYIELRSILEQDCSATGSVETPTMTISR